MLFCRIHPFVRYARYLHLDKTSTYEPHIPYDARLFYVVEGTGRIDVMGSRIPDTGDTGYSSGNTLSLSGTTSYTLKKGDLLLINSGVKYHLVTPQRSISYLAINFDYSFDHAALSVPIPPKTEGAFVPEQIVEHILFEDLPEANVSLLVREMFESEQKLLSIMDEYTHSLIYSDMKTSSLLSEVLIEAARKARFNSAASDTGRMKKVNPRIIIDYIHENYNKPLTNKEISAVFGYHPNYVSDLVKLYTGMPLHQYLLHIRLVRAANYLDMGTLSVSEIAAECGFGSIYYFSRYFKRFTGISPTEYKQN